MRIRSSIVTAVYRKALRLSNSARQGSTVGEITNLMSVDASRISDLCNYGHILWSGPLQIGLAIYFLYDALGPSIFAGVAMMIAMVPFNTVLATKSRTLNKEQMGNKDVRTKLIDEVLCGMKVIKLYAWETPFMEKITAARNLELASLKKIAYLSAAQSFTWSCTPFLVSFSTFAFYSFTNEELLTSTKVFLALALFNLLQFPLAMFPSVIAATVEASVSFSRLFKFLMNEELDDSAVQRLLVPPFVDPKDRIQRVTIDNGSFGWSADSPATISNISLKVADGTLFAIVGTVASGKSTLLSAILGETYKMAGAVTVRGSIAYVPQTPWIMVLFFNGRMRRSGTM